MNFYIDQFISEKIINRPESMFQADIDRNAFKLNERIRNRSVLVIGGAGTIGSSFIKSLLPFNPKKLVVVDLSENELTELTRDLRSSVSVRVPDHYITYPLSFASPVFHKVLNREGPFEIVANFAAHKHVRSEKDELSIEAMIHNNVINAYELLSHLERRPPEKFFCVSTDKATNPVNVMGASKKLMEDVIMSFKDQLNITTARFANVAFSNGSLLYGFLRRLEKRQPLSCPSNVRRYFVSPEESGQICLLSCMLGDSGDIFYPKLDSGSMKFFKDITLDFLYANNFEADICSTEEEAKKKASALTTDQREYPVFFFATDTSGEKLFEEFFSDNDVIDTSKFNGLGIIKSPASKSRGKISEVVDSLKELFRKEQLDKSDLVLLLQSMISDFSHIETGKTLDQRM